MKVSISQAAKELGVRPETLRRWEAEGKITAERTPKGHRRYDLTVLNCLRPHLAPSSRVSIAYARVSSHDQRDDLARQVALLESLCAANGWSHETIQDIGSGLNYQKRGLKTLVQHDRDEPSVYLTSGRPL